MSQESGATPKLIANEPKVIDVLVDLYWQSRMGNSGHGATLKRRLASNKTRPSIGAVGSMSKTEAKRKLRQFLEQIGLNSLCHVIPPEMSSRMFGEVSDQWEERVLNGKKRSTRRTMKSELRKHLRPAFGKLSMDCITAQMVTDYAAEWHSSGLSVKSVRNLVITLNIIRKYAGMPIFSAKSVTFPSVTEARKEVPCFTSQDVFNIIAGAKGWCKVYFATAAGTGLRAGELAGLRIETGDVDFGRKLIHVRRSVFEGEEQSPKSQNAYRWIPIDDELAAMMKDHIGDRTFGYVFHSRRGSPVRLNNILRRVLHPLLRDLKIPVAGMHAFRHYRCSFLVEHNVPIPVIKEWIGQGSERMIRRYTHHRPEYHSAILARLPSAFHTQKEDKISLFVPKTNLTEGEESRKLEQNQGLTNLGG